MKPKFHNTPSPFGRGSFAVVFTFVRRPHWEIRDTQTLIRAAGLVFAAMALLMAASVCAQNIQPVYSFPQSPAVPYAALVPGPDGNFYGTTWSGGSGGEGTVIEVKPNGQWTTLYSFGPPTASAGTFVTNLDGAKPESALTPGADGSFYGTTSQGGSGGNGTVFKLTTNGVLTTFHFFGARPDGANPEAGLTLGPDGNFYGTTQNGGTNGNGTVFKVTTNGVLTTLHSFTASHLDSVHGDYTNSDGAGPEAGLTLGTNGSFYGTCSAGGSGDSGTVFAITTNGVLTTIYTFSAQNYDSSSTGEANTNSDGASPVAALTLGADGSFYGTTYAGGSGGSGTLFKVTPNGTLTTLYTFPMAKLIFSGASHALTNSDGAGPWAGLAPGPNGNFYGAARSGGSSGLGTLFELVPGGKFTRLLTFTNGNGANPGGTLTLGTNGNFYGTTGEGGSAGNGTVFEVSANGAFATLISFALYNGASPYAGLTLGPDGNFYGTTYQGGTNGAGIETGPDGYGTVFEITPNGGLTTLVSLGGTNGANPQAGLTPGPNGNFYGTTYSGGSNGYGSVFQITINGVCTLLASFTGTNGENPAAALTLGTNGNFYGTTLHGGANNYGAVFEVTTNGSLTLLHSFNGVYYDSVNGADTNFDGAYPYAGLTLGTNGNFYGTSAYGGQGGYGTVFEVTSTGGFTALYSFTNGSDGACPYAGLTLGQNGNFYGTTSGDDSSTYGNVFELTPDGALTNLHSFTGGNDSGSPCAALTLGPDGNFYGTTYGSSDPYGGLNLWGTVFEVTSNGAFTTLVSFAGTNGENSKASLTLGADGNFYGTASSGGADGIGEIYRLNLPPEIIQQPASQSMPPGGPVALSVTLFGTAPYGCQWMSNNIPIAGATNRTLNIPNFAAGDAASYSIVVSNAWGSATSTAASLTVPGQPLISCLTVTAGANVTLNCQTLTNVMSRLWATTNLASQTDWTPIFTNSVTSPGAWQFTDPNRMYQQRYYRLSTP